LIKPNEDNFNTSLNFVFIITYFKTSGFELLRFFIIINILYLLPTFTGQNSAQAFFYFEEAEPKVESEKPTKKTDEKISEKKHTEGIQRSDIKIAKPISLFAQQKQDLSHYLLTDKIQKIDVGDNKYILVEQSSSTQNNKGVAILLPDWQQGITNPKALNFLRTHLPKKGWSTLSIQSPSKPLNYPYFAINEKERLEQNKKALLQYNNELKSLMSVVMEKAKNYPGIFLVISKGNQAAMLIDLYKNNPDLSPAALIMLSAGLQSPEENTIFAINMAKIEIPVLDLVLVKDNKLVLQNALLRKKQAIKEMKVVYRQKSVMDVMPGYYPEQTLLREINGWLKTIGW